MQKSPEELLSEAESFSEEASKLLREFVDWKHRVITFAKDALFYQGDSRARKEEASTPEKLLTFLTNAMNQPDNLRYRFKLQDDDAAFREKEKKDEESAELRRAEELKLTEDALLFLQENGKILGTDFSSLGNAISIADNLAFEIEIERKIKNRTVEFFSFTGNDQCDDSCKGWDGESHRCECGSRRVAWEFNYNHSFKHPSICAEAY